jgi:hypothetical protein
MNKWYLGYINEYPVEVFLSEDFSLDCSILGDIEYTAEVLKACERIRATSEGVRSLAGAKRVLAENGWSNS